MTWLNHQDVSIDELARLVAEPIDLSDYPSARELRSGALVYDRDLLVDSARDPQSTLAAELVGALLDGPGIILVPAAVPVTAVEAATEEFERLLARERASGRASGDHFAAAGANERLWNSLEKLGRSAPDAFVEYFNCPAFDMICRAWLGPGYQATAQLNVVNPGGTAQSAHRDYHLGFMEVARAEQFPLHTHRLSPVLTLQAAIAHDEMPVETGPTTYLPGSQRWDHGYLAWPDPAVQAFFDEHHEQPELHPGDLVCFNPALFHAAGANRTSDRRRMANLLQISSAFGRSIEKVDRRALVESIYPTLLDAVSAGRSADEFDAVVSMSAEGYAFPCDLDHHQPVDGMTHPTMADHVRTALSTRTPLEQLRSVLD